MTATDGGVPVTLIPQPGGLFTAARADGSVESVQPDGSLQTRPAGTAGPYELCAVNGNVRVYNPTGSHLFYLPYFATVPRG